LEYAGIHVTMSSEAKVIGVTARSGGTAFVAHEYFIELRKSDHECWHRWDSYAAALAGLEVFFGLGNKEVDSFEHVEILL
jgi:hypothetical protein